MRVIKKPGVFARAYIHSSLNRINVTQIAGQKELQPLWVVSFQSR
jgi:hypothetical protein